MLIVTFFYLFLDCKHVLMKTYLRKLWSQNLRSRVTTGSLLASSTCQNIHQGVPHQQTSNISFGRTLYCHVKAINIYKTKISIHCVLMKEKNLMQTWVKVHLDLKRHHFVLTSECLSADILGYSWGTAYPLFCVVLYITQYIYIQYTHSSLFTVFGLTGSNILMTCYKATL